MSQTSVRRGREAGYALEKREGARSLFLPLDQGCGLLRVGRAVGARSPSQVWSPRGTRGLAAPVLPVVAHPVVLQGGHCHEVLTGHLTAREATTLAAARVTLLSPPAGPGEAVPEGLQRGCVLWGWRGLLPVQRVRALPGGAAAAAHPHRSPDKAGALGLGPASVPTRGRVALGTPQGPGDSAGELCLGLLSGGRETEGGAGGPGASPGAPGTTAAERGVPEACPLKDCGCDPKMPRWGQRPRPLGLPARRSGGPRAHSRGADRPSPRVADWRGSLRHRWLIFLQYLRWK